MSSFIPHSVFIWQPSGFPSWKRVGLAVLCGGCGAWSLYANSGLGHYEAEEPIPGIEAIQNAADHTATDHGNEIGLQHEFAAPGEKVSLQSNFEVDVERSILEEDDRLKARLENALDVHDENELVKFVDMDIGDSFKRRVLLTLGEIYEKQNSSSRLIALYEKFIMEFPKDAEVPKLYLRLGRMYRDSGASKTALAKFYNVLNVALSVPVDELKEYQEVSHRAQLEIAETFFGMGSYDQAAKFFKRLLRIDLVDEDRQNVLFKYAYTIYLAGNYNESIPTMKSFIASFPESDMAPEARYLLSETFMRLNDPKSALKETLELLTSEVSKINTNPATWLYWKKRTGNRLANQFYQEGNYLDALTIYRAMVDITNEPGWTWPVLYQVGLCYEKLDMKPKAIDAFKRIVSEEKTLSETDRKDLTLSSILEMAMWRVDRLEMDITMELDLQKILSNS